MKYHHSGLGWAAMAFPVIGLLLAASAPCLAQAKPNTPGAKAEACPADNGGITVPRGFCATVFADNIGHARHLVVAPNGVVYVNTWSGRYYGNDQPPAGGFLLALQDTKGEGRADIITRFGDSAADGSHGGTGIALYNGALYAEVNDRIVRYTLPAGALAPTAPPEVIVSGLPLTGDHPMHPFAIDRQGNLFVDLGSATNSCQVENRTLELAGDHALYGARNARRHLALRREPDRAALLSGRALRHWDPQWRGLRIRRRRWNLCNPTWPGSVVGELAETLPAGAGPQSPRRRATAIGAGRRLRLAGVLFRRDPGEACAGSGIWR